MTDGYLASDGYLSVQSKATLRVCADCGAVIGNPGRHRAWHVNVIGGLQSASDPRMDTDDSARGGR